MLHRPILPARRARWPAHFAWLLPGASGGEVIMRSAGPFRECTHLGFPVGIGGEEFAQRAYIQALRFGASIVVPAAATGLSGDSAAWVIQLDSGAAVTARSVIVSTGVSYRKIDATGLDRFAGLGVAYSPLGVDEVISSGDRVVIVGGGNSAEQAAVALAGRGYAVTIVIRGTDLRASMSRYLIGRIVRRAEIDVRYRTLVRRVDGGERLERIEVEDIASHVRETFPAAALIVLAGADPHTGWLAKSLALDDGGYIRTGEQLGLTMRHRSPWTGGSHEPYLLETSAPGVFAAGDVRSGSLKRVAAAVGEGAIAARFVSEHLGSHAAVLGPGTAA